tara:strand:- start:281 stop:415 length:135 start_codon:yes stop_codon:yes gene_type:complete
MEMAGLSTPTTKEKASNRPTIEAAALLDPKIASSEEASNAMPAS